MCIAFLLRVPPSLFHILIVLAILGQLQKYAGPNCHFRQILGPAFKLTGNGNRTEWSTIWSVIIRVINRGSLICFIITRMIT